VAGMNGDLIRAINQICSERKLKREVVFAAIEAALVSAYKRNFGATAANVMAKVDPATGAMRVFAEKEVVEKVTDHRTEISLTDARRVKPDAALGDVIQVEATPDNFGRIAAQTAKQVILQRIREAERDTVYDTFVEREGELVSGTVQRRDPASGDVLVLLDGAEGILAREDQLPTERYRHGGRIRAYLLEVHRGNRGPVIRLSRTHRNMLRRLLEQEVPEVFNGSVEIKSIAREPGYRSKVAVAALQPGVDPVGSCVGMRGIRIQNIVNELSGEKIDVVEWSPDTATFIANALSPARVTDVLLHEGPDGKTAVVIVPDRQLSLAIGKEGQNARLAAKLTGWRIDIKSESEAAAEGLDQLARDRARLAAAARAVAEEKPSDLLAVAEQILRDQEVAPGGEEEAESPAILEAAELLPAEPTELETATEAVGEEEEEEAPSGLEPEALAAAIDRIAGVTELSSGEMEAVEEEAPGIESVPDETSADLEEMIAHAKEIPVEELAALMRERVDRARKRAQKAKEPTSEAEGDGED